MITAIGYVGAFLLAFCSLPLLVKAVHDGHAKGVSLWFLVMWWGGELLMLGHVALSPHTRPLLANYIANVAIVAVILWYRIRFARRVARWRAWFRRATE